MVSTEHSQISAEGGLILNIRKKGTRDDLFRIGLDESSWMIRCNIWAFGLFKCIISSKCRFCARLLEPALARNFLSVENATEIRHNDSEHRSLARNNLSVEDITERRHNYSGHRSMARNNLSVEDTTEINSDCWLSDILFLEILRLLEFISLIRRSCSTLVPLPKLASFWFCHLLFELIAPHLLWEIFESSASLKVYYMILHDYSIQFLVLPWFPFVPLLVHTSEHYQKWSIPLLLAEILKFNHLLFESITLHLLSENFESRAIMVTDSCNTRSERQRIRRSLTTNEELSIWREESKQEQYPF